MKKTSFGTTLLPPRDQSQNTNPEGVGKVGVKSLSVVRSLFSHKMSPKEVFQHVKLEEKWLV